MHHEPILTGHEDEGMSEIIIKDMNVSYRRSSQRQLSQLNQNASAYMYPSLASSVRTHTH